MWLLVAGDVAPPGGMDRANHALAAYLAARGPVRLVTHRAADDLRSNVTVRRVPRPLGRDFLGERLLRRAGVQEARRFPGRVVVNGGCCPWPDVNWVHCVHAAMPTALRPIPRFIQMVHRREEQQAVRMARVVVANSPFTAALLIERLHVPPDRLRVVYLGTDPAAFGPVSPAERSAARDQLGWADRPWVGYVGQLADRVKGFDTLYEAWRRLCGDPRWDANLAVVGGGRPLLRWRARAAAELPGRVQFLGVRPDVPRVLAACDVLVHPARYDGYGLAVQEAVCRGLPAVVSAAAGVSGRFGSDLQDFILVHPDDPAELVEMLRHWRTLTDAAGRFAGLAAELRRHTWDDMARQFVEAVA